MSFQISKNVTTAATPVRLVATSELTITNRFCARATIVAKKANTGTIYVILATTTPAAATGVPLLAGESYTIGVGETRGNPNDLAHAWLDSTVNGEGAYAMVEQI